MTNEPVATNEQVLAGLKLLSEQRGPESKEPYPKELAEKLAELKSKIESVAQLDGDTATVALELLKLMLARPKPPAGSPQSLADSAFGYADAFMDLRNQRLKNARAIARPLGEEAEKLLQEHRETLKDQAETEEADDGTEAAPPETEAPIDGTLRHLADPPDPGTDPPPEGEAVMTGGVVDGEDGKSTYVLTDDELTTVKALDAAGDQRAVNAFWRGVGERSGFDASTVAGAPHMDDERYFIAKPCGVGT